MQRGVFINTSTIIKTKSQEHLACLLSKIKASTKIETVIIPCRSIMGQSPQKSSAIIYVILVFMFVFTTTYFACYYCYCYRDRYRRHNGSWPDDIELYQQRLDALEQQEGISVATTVSGSANNTSSN